MSETVRIGASEVLIGRGRSRNWLPPRDNRNRVALLFQPTVAELGAELADEIRETGVHVAVKGLPDGEAAKSLAVAEEVYVWLADVGLERTDTIVGLGGGSATDLVGFVAATWMRGVESVYVPTTLLAAVDASLGGKTAVNVGAKNLVGVFWDPARVIIDLELLEDLPLQTRREGMAEALKAGMIGDPELVGLLRHHGADVPLAQLVRRAVAVKASFVNADPREAGVRAMLNYGHTVGHALEAIAGLSHGQAIGLGMVAAGVISERMVGFEGAADQAGLVSSLGLPTEVEDVSAQEILRAVRFDKKREKAETRMVLLRGIGEPEVLSVDDIEDGLAAIGVV